MAGNLHTHSVHAGCRELISSPLPIAGYFSLEYHPWQVPENFCALPEDYLSAAPAAAALGETGLDRLRGAPLKTQLRAFEAVCEVAVQLNKSVIVHAVRCDSELAAVARHYPLRFLVHGFRHSVRRLESLLERGMMISLAPGAWRQNELREYLRRHGDFSRIGFESDTSELPFAEIFREAQQCLEIPGLDAASDSLFDRIVGISG